MPRPLIQPKRPKSDGFNRRLWDYLYGSDFVGGRARISADDLARSIAGDQPVPFQGRTGVGSTYADRTAAAKVAIEKEQHQNKMKAARTRIVRWVEEGGHEPAADGLRDICDATGLSADYLLYGQGPEFRGEVLTDAEREGWIRGHIVAVMVSRGKMPAADAEGIGILLQVDRVLEALDDMVVVEAVQHWSWARRQQTAEHLRAKPSMSIADSRFVRSVEAEAPPRSRFFEWNDGDDPFGSTTLSNELLAWVNGPPTRGASSRLPRVAAKRDP